MPVTIRLALVEDHKLVTEALNCLFQLDPRIKVVGAAQTPEAALRLIQTEAPDVTILDLSLGKASGLDLLPQLQTTKVCAVSMHISPHFVTQALRRGAIGYVSKDASPAELLEGIYTVARGETFLCSIGRKVAFSVKGFLTGGSKDSLSGREQQVLELAAWGRTSSEIAAELKISRRTAEAHRANLMKKLALKTQTDLVLYSLRTGIIPGYSGAVQTGIGRQSPPSSQRALNTGRCALVAGREP